MLFILMYGRAGCPQPAETILNLDGSKSFINAEIIPIEVMISDGGLRASRPTVVLNKTPIYPTILTGNFLYISPKLG